MLVLSNIRRKMEQTNEKEIKKTKSSVSKTSSTEKKEPAVKKATKTTATKKVSTSKKATVSETTATKKAATSKKATASETTATKKAATSKKATASKTTATKKTTTSKKATTSKTTATKKTTTSKKATVTKAKAVVEVPVPTDTSKELVDLQKILDINEKTKPAEYYDLPYRYNQTTIKILAQTPHSIFLYWDIADADRKVFVDTYGEDFFNTTKPVLLVHNKTQNYSFEVEVDDFTNSWYLRTPTSNCVFEVELGRKKINTYDSTINFGSIDDRLHISVSNDIESPNDHIINDFPRNIYFKNVKTNELEERKVNALSIIKNLYKKYELEDTFIHNPSSDFRI